MARDLYSRLKRLKGAGSHLERTSSRVEAGAPSEQKAVPAGHVSLPGWREVSPLVFSRRFVATVPGLPDGPFVSRLLGREISLGELRFMDTETTGLSGGAGTIVFLTGWAECTSEGVEITQTFLADFPREPEYLEILHRELWGGSTWVSYNGRAFDFRLLQTRFLMNGLSVDVPPQVDLLYWSRRLWKRRIGPCGLDDVEREILGVRRELDVPGAEIPDIYFDFLRDGTTDRLGPVFAHHVQDIVTLVLLFLRIEDVLRSCAAKAPLSAAVDFDRVSLGRYLADRSHPDGAALLERVLLTPLSWETIPEREQAAFALARYRRRIRSPEPLESIWTKLWEDGSLHAGIQLAKIAEHQRRDAAQARRLVTGLLEQAKDELIVRSLERRLDRLRRKLER